MCVGRGKWVKKRKRWRVRERERERERESGRRENFCKRQGRERVKGKTYRGGGREKRNER